MSYGFHSKQDLYFERDDDGNVVIRKVHRNRVLFEVTLDTNTWGSAVASVSARGENAETFNEAVQFHRREG